MQGDFHIDDWLVQPQLNAVEKGAKHFRLEPKVMQVLVQLALHPNEVLSKDRLMSTVWRDTFVGDDVLVRCISEIRYVFGDDAKSPTVVQTISKGGYRLIASVTTELDTAAPLLPLRRIEASPPAQALMDGRELERVAAAPTTEKTLFLPEPVICNVTKRTEIVAENHEPNAATEALAVPLPGQQVAPRNEKSATRIRPIALVCMIAFIAIAAITWGSMATWRVFHPSAFSLFWAPILDARGPILFCLADQNEYTSVTLRDASNPSRTVLLKDNLSAVVMDDLDAVIRLASIFKVYGKDYRLKGQEVATLNDMRNGPSVFVGAFDNAWTLRLTNPLRFHFANNSDMTEFGIVDRESPARSDWIVNRTQQMATNVYKDYAIVARFADSDTGQPAVIAAGVGRGGTEAAAEFLTAPDTLSQVLPALRASPGKKNIEIVLSTQIIDGHSGRPKVEAIYIW